MPLSLLLLAACDAPRERDPAFRCATDHGGAYPPRTSYAGIHGGPRNDDFVDCEAPADWAPAWHALQGTVIAQPNTFSPDGRTIYVTTSQPRPDDCSVHALDAETGETEWCLALSGAITSSVEVDAAGDLYVGSDTAIVSLRPDGAERWRVTLPQPDDATNPNGAIGLHFDPKGRLVTLTDLGVLLVLDRATGDPIASLDLPAATGFVPPASLAGEFLDLSSIVPPEVLEDFEAMNGADFDLLSFIGSGGQFSDNTVAIAPDGAILVTGGGPSPTEGALLRVEERAGGLEVSFYAPFRKGSAASPSVSRDGRWARISDGNSPGSVLGLEAPAAAALLFDLQACGANTDADADPARCAAAHDVALSGPSLGAAPVFDGGEHYLWESAFADLFREGVPDVSAWRKEDRLWATDLPDGALWSSVLTLTRDRIVGTMTRLTPSTSQLLTITLPETAESEVVALDRATGEVVFRAPVTDDATSTVTVGPDGSLYVNQLGLLHAFAVDTRVTGGVMKFEPR
jgi:outer membrane protein assembly factor BamB